jgi:hypothetical protein
VDGGDVLKIHRKPLIPLNQIAGTADAVIEVTAIRGPVSHDRQAVTTPVRTSGDLG